MYRKRQTIKTGLNISNTVQGEPIEDKLERIVNNNEPITDGSPPIYTERKEGVLAGYNIRTDRFEVAIDAMDKVQASKQASREEKGKVIPIKSPENGTAEPTQGTKDN